MIESLRGKRCATVRRFQHRFGDEPAGQLGALELGWTDGAFTTLDANSDWTLDVSFQPWVDPFAGVSPEDRQRLAIETGLWAPAPLPPELSPLVGRIVTGVDPMNNEAGELSGLRIAFGEIRVVARTYGGELIVQALREMR